ncbi:hypothetical protein [Ornithobacterium rhinotracheale]|uniref:Uncharacterized protein n=2 Tax=Ornithobacterium rhinotracheale TaxID=28251 RepID=I3ZXC4_ORNRL|nr:hypothetical protein [Ornithobacterium rhinotracheale]AFL96358.1 hypothetical protein Ornrh_0132 [Ornithobacterium rhinotracheale DSM 15997]AIP98595.1 hypothetical protein Q785_00760 [Ornithobacterium rhinotracheale ORT-UMN 88]MCK0194682.1 hypothetical protein [Ornithobacterium rhinotracheale]MCK0202338.1 hypothetical protein [Ornithobacterium rhinotracheale]UOH63072.1 hypothetical protein MT993_08645 [Ornithobacterium rhinotracheale]
MKKFLFTTALCMASLLSYSQSKEAKKEIRKYYTEKQIKFIQNRLNENITDCDELLHLRDSLIDDFFENEQHALIYKLFFLSPIEKDLCTRGDILGYYNNINHYISGK